MSKVIEFIEHGRTIWLAMLSMLAGLAWAGDQYFVSDADLEKVMVQQRVMMLNDRIFEIEVKGVEISAVENAVLERHKREREELLKEK